MAQALSSIGVKVSYIVESTAGTRPTAGYNKIPGIKSTPDLNIAPNTADVTSFDNVNYTTKIPLLKEMPDNIEFTGVFSQDLYDKWSAMCTAYTALTGGKQLWLCIDIPGFDKAFYIPVQPSQMGLPAMDVNSSIDVSLFVTTVGELTIDTKPTYVA